jgi:hypothetical protein
MVYNIAPVSVGGFGSISLSTSSVAVSTAVAGPGSGAFPTELPNRCLTIWNSAASGGNCYVAPLGGTAVAATCLPLVPGQNVQFTTNGTTVPTIISDSTATVFVIW